MSDVVKGEIKFHTHTGLKMRAGGEAGVPFDLYGTRAALSQQLNPLIGFARRLANGKDFLDQRAGYLERVLDAFGVRETVRVDPSDGDVAFKLER